MRRILFLVIAVVAALPLAAQGVCLIEDCRDPALLVERGERDFQLFQKSPRHAALPCAPSHPLLTEVADGILPQEIYEVASIKV